MSFCVVGLDPAPFEHLVGLPDAALKALGATRIIVDAKPGFPDRVTVRDLEIGETAILLNYEHQPAQTAYRSRHAIFVGEGLGQALDLVDRLPDAILSRQISLRAFSASGEMLDAELADGSFLEPIISRFLADPGVAYLHAYYAKRGCYAARIERC
ncbi:DUF1203 domain-containing protein [Sphingomonas sp.]|uniref:DUF1203 domain-containing protein n=1 Tax=Sphingomonas sp. TaxID=28214 RepID=UPI000DB360AE|nr:DUF1203 domain-containing protein [Sphingomonas sp.]PZU09535.1 MAG: DUF1203 domain-containing protein [Sphingomonas sp.]